jgi:hypothetical protein
MRLAVLVLLPLAARAGTFDDLRAKATEPADVRAALEPFLWKCTDAEPYLRHRCDLLKRRLMMQRAEQTYRTTVGPEAVRVLARDRPEPTLEVVLRGCVACDQPLVLEDGLVGSGFVTTRRPKAVRPREGAPGRFDLVDLDFAKQTVAPDGKTPSQWRDAFAANLRAEIVFRPTAGPGWWVGVEPRYEGIVVEILGYRIFDRCTGSVVASSAPAQPVAGVEKTDATCPGYVAPVVVAPKPIENLPKTLTRAEIERAFELAHDDVMICYERNGVPGYAPTRVVIGGADGHVRSATVGGKFEGTPTGECVAKAVSGLTFPRFSDKELVVNWQFFLR